MKVLLYGGTFDPPHNGHLNNLRAAAARVQPDKVVVMPAGLSPFKQKTSAPGALRLEMCSCFHALEEDADTIPQLEVSGWRSSRPLPETATIRCSRWKNWLGKIPGHSCTLPLAAICC